MIEGVIGKETPLVTVTVWASGKQEGSRNATERDSLLLAFGENSFLPLRSGRNGVMVSASDCHPKDRSSIPGQNTLVSTAVSQGESI